MLPNNADPLCADDVSAAGAGGAVRRMNAAKLTVSDDRSETLPTGLPFTVRLVPSSGPGLKTQPGTAERSLGKTSFETPCSTLYASPANINSDLFWAFQPNRVTVPSLPMVLRLPLIPSADFAAWFAARLALSVESGVFSTSPSPNSGVGMRKITLLFANCCA